MQSLTKSPNFGFCADEATQKTSEYHLNSVYVSLCACANFCKVYLVEPSCQFFAGIAFRGFDSIKIRGKTDRQQHQEIQKTEKRLQSTLFPRRTGHRLQSPCRSSTGSEDAETGSPIKRRLLAQHVAQSPSAPTLRPTLQHAALSWCARV